MNAPIQKPTVVSKPTPPPSRMTLANVTRGKLQQAWRMMVYGVEGIGKSSLGAAAPSPIFLGAEEGTGHLDVSRFPAPSGWADMRAAVRELKTQQHDYKTLVVDTVDWVEPLIWAHIAKRDGVANVEDYGYGKGYVVALDEWRGWLAELEGLRAVGVNVLLLGHCHIRPFKNPEGEDFDRYELKIHAKAGGLLREWCDLVLFANHETYAKKDEKKKFAKAKGVSTGSRWLYTERTAAYDAKNRHNLPTMLPLDFAALDAAMKGPDVGPMVEEIRAKAAQLPAADAEAALAAITRAGGDASKLALLNNWVNTRLTLTTTTQSNPQKES